MQIDKRSFMHLVGVLWFVAGFAAHGIIRAAVSLQELNLFHMVALLWAAVLGLAILVLSFK